MPFAPALAPRAWDQNKTTCLPWDGRPSFPVANGTRLWAMPHMTNASVMHLYAWRVAAEKGGLNNGPDMGGKNGNKPSVRPIDDAPDPQRTAAFEKCCSGGDGTGPSASSQVQFHDCFFWCKAPDGARMTDCAPADDDLIGGESFFPMVEIFANNSYETDDDAEGALGSGGNARVAWGLLAVLATTALGANVLGA